MSEAIEKSASVRPIKLDEPSHALIRRQRVTAALHSPVTTVGVGVAAAGLSFLVPAATPISLAMIALYGAACLVVGRRARRFKSKLISGYNNAEHGDFDELLARCTDGMAGEPYPTSHRCALIIASVLRRQARFDEAIEILGTAARSKDAALRRAIGVELAVCYALKGATGPAMTWLPAIERRRSELAAAYALVWLRTGKGDEVHKLRVQRSRASDPFIRHEARLLPLLKAYARFRRQADYLSFRGLLLEAGPAFPTEFDYLGAAWPEMAEFLETYVTPAA